MPSRSVRSRVALHLLCLCAFSSLSQAATKQFVMPVAQSVKSYPARDEHANEFVTVALDPYDMADKAAIFTAPYNQNGFLPIFVVIRNDGNQPVTLENMKVEFITVDRTKIPRATQEDIYRRLARPESTPSPSPLPWPKKVKGGISEKTRDEIDRAQFAAKAVEPHSAQAGFMFFDVSGISTPLAGATVYLSGVNDAKGDELMYFEIPLEKYLSAPTK
ncbi:MAG: hypothetical protein ABSE92_03200 [Terriglobales bacterium]